MFRYSRNFWHDEFRAERDKEILKCDLNNIEFHHFLKLFTQDSSKHVHLKKKYLKANQQRFMTKELYKAIVNHSRLCNKFLRYIKNNEVFGIILHEKVKTPFRKTRYILLQITEGSSKM